MNCDRCGKDCGSAVTCSECSEEKYSVFPVYCKEVEPQEKSYEKSRVFKCTKREVKMKENKIENLKFTIDINQDEVKGLFQVRVKYYIGSLQKIIGRNEMLYYQELAYSSDQEYILNSMFDNAKKEIIPEVLKQFKAIDNKQ